MRNVAEEGPVHHIVLMAEEKIYPLKIEIAWWSWGD